MYRLYVEEKLSLWRKRGRKRSTVRQPLPEPVAPNQVWSVDFMTDALSSGRTFRTLNIVDDFTPAIEVDTSLGGVRVIRVVEELKQRRGLPRQISDNGPEFLSRAVDQWAYEQGLQWHTIQPWRPMENAYVESFITSGQAQGGRSRKAIGVIKGQRAVTETSRDEVTSEAVIC